jgi:hypothetical protein
MPIPSILRWATPVRVCFAVVAAFLLTAVPVHAQVIRAVNAAGPGGPGPWAAATTDLRAALLASAPGDQVWVAAGTYRPAPPGGTRTLSFTVPSGVRVYGGFSGTEASFSERSGDPSLFPTILSGDLNGDDTVGANRGDNALRVVVITNANDQTVLDRFTIRSGNSAAYPSAPIPADVGPGAGLYITSSSVRISDCRIADNATGRKFPAAAAVDGADGAGAYISGGAPVFTRCTFDSNTCGAGGYLNQCISGTGQPGGVGGNGGGVFALNSSPSFISCNFTKNASGAGNNGLGCVNMPSPGTAAGYGGAFASSGSACTFTLCSFSLNTAASGGAGGVSGQSGAVAANGPGGNGGALSITGGAPSTITACRFTRNSAGPGVPTTFSGFTNAPAGGAGGSGGALWVHGATVTIINSLFADNAAGNGGSGGLIFNAAQDGGPGGNGGAIAASSTAQLALRACTITRNAPGAGGPGAPQPVACRPFGPGCRSNSNGPNGTGGGLLLSASGSTITSSIVFSNSGIAIGGGFPPVTTYSCIEGGITGTGNIASDPAFASPGSGDFHLQPTSPCIDAGSTPALAGQTTDLDGQPRFIDLCAIPNTGLGPAPIPDMGCFETQETSNDCNANGVCDSLELLGLPIPNPTPGVNDRFAWALDIEGNTAAIGARTDDTASGIDSGSVTIYSRTPSGWSPVQTLLPPANSASADFGNQVAIDGSTLAIAARTTRVGAVVNAGAVYIYRLSGATWSLAATLTAPDPSPDAQFGHGLALSGGSVLIGALRTNGAATRSGAVYVFRDNSIAWVFDRKLFPADGAIDDGFGIAVATSGPYAVIGAPYVDTLGLDAGAIYIYFNNPISGWGQTAKLLARDSGPADNFGELVAISDDHVLANAPRHTHSGVLHAGAAYTFRRTGATWYQQAKLTSNHPDANENFGFGIALDGGRALIGGFARPSGVLNGAGAAYIFSRAANRWTLADRIDAPAPVDAGYFGYAAAISGDTALIGSFGATVGNTIFAGEARVFDLRFLDCDRNSRIDRCQIAAGQAVDTDANNIPDPCQFGPCPADFNGSGGASVQDIFDFLSDFFAQSLTADFNGTGAVTVQDIFDYLTAYFAGC